MTSIDNIILTDQLNNLLLEMGKVGIRTSMFYSITLTKTDGQLRLQGDKRRIKRAKNKLASIGFKASWKYEFVRGNVTLILA